jgi:hypothetical protein
MTFTRGPVVSEDDEVARLIANLRIRPWGVTYGELLVVLSCKFRQIVDVDGLTGLWFANDVGHFQLDDCPTGEFLHPGVVREVLKLIDGGVES